MATTNHQVNLTIFTADGTVDADRDPVKIKAGDSLQFNVHFADGGADPPYPDGPAVEVRFTASGPFTALKGKAGVITGVKAQGRFGYKVFLKGKALRWRPPIRGFGGVDVGGGRPQT